MILVWQTEQASIRCHKPGGFRKRVNYLFSFCLVHYTLLMSMKAVAYGQFLALAFLSSVERTKIASIVLRPRRNPNCSGPRMLFASVTSVMVLHIRTVSNLRMFDGIVMGRYWPGWRESPP